MDAAQWPQQGVERRVRPPKGQALNCPRCNSTNTKFCYYNNYSLSQPRYFCKSCRRYWTEGGSLRNVPIGGGSRKNKRSYSSSSSSQTSSTTTLAATASSTSLISSSLASKLIIPHELRSFSISSSVSAIEPIRSGISSRRSIPFEVSNLSKENELSTNARIRLHTLTPSDQSLYWQELHALGMPKPRDFGIQELICPSMVKIPLEDGVGGMKERKEGEDGKLPFPFEDLKQGTIRNDCDEIVEGGVDPTLFWEGIMGNGEGGGGW